MASKLLKEMADAIHNEVHDNPDESHGYDKEDVLHAAVLLHAVMMDVAAPYLLEKVGSDMATMLAGQWGRSLRDQLEIMVDVDASDYIKE